MLAAIAAAGLVTTALVVAPAGASPVSAGTLQLTQPSFEATESAGSLVLDVGRVDGDAGAVSAGYTVTAATATAGTDYTAVSGTVSWVDGDSTPQPISVPLVDDGLDEGDEIFVVRISSPTGGAALGVQSHAIGVIVDDDTSHTINTANGGTPVSVHEGEDVIVSLTLDGNANGDVTVPYTVEGITATPDTDFDGSGGVATIADGTNFGEATISTVADNDAEGVEAFVIHFGTASDGSELSGSPDVAALIGDVDAPAGVYTFDQPAAELTEGQGGITMPARRDGVAGEVGATLSLSDLTTDGDDGVAFAFGADGAIGSTADGNAVSSVPIDAVDDGVVEGSELASVAITAPTGGVGIGDTPDQLLIVRDAQTPSGGIELGQVSGSPTAAGAIVTEGDAVHIPVVGPNGGSVDYELFDITATGGDDYVVASGTVDLSAITGEIVIQTSQDTAAEPTETFGVRLTNPQGDTIGRNDLEVITIADDETAPRLLREGPGPIDEGNEGTVTLTPSHAHSSSMSVGYTVVPMVADASDFDGPLPSGTVTWPAGDAGPRTITIPIASDALVEPYETYGVVLHDATGLRLPDDFGDGVRRPGMANAFDVDFITGTAATTRSISVVAYDCDGIGTDRVFAEGSTAEVAVGRNSGDGAATVDYTTVDASAVAGSDYTATSGTLSWDDNDLSPQCISVPTANDATAEGQEAVGVVLSNATGGARLTDPATWFAISDGLSTGTVQLTTAGPTDVTEGAGSVTVDVVRAGGSDGAASVHVSTADGTASAGSDYTAIDTTLSWSDGESGTKSATLQVTQDGDDEPNEDLTVSLSLPSGVVLGTPSSRTFRILDDDGANQAPVVDAGGPYNVAEGSTVQLDGTGTDPEGDAVTYSWTPTANLDDASLADPTFTGVDDDVVTETLEVCDAVPACATDTADVTVTNVAPVVTGVDQSSDAAGALTDAVVATFTDAGVEDTHAATIDWGDGGGAEAATVDDNTGNVTGSHAFTSDGDHVIEVCVTDDDGGSDCANATITVDTGGGGGGNSTPDAVDDDVTITETSGTTTIDVLANDTDDDFDPLTVSAADATSAHGGTVDCSSTAACDYTPPTGYVGTDTFHYTVSDGNGGTDSATVTITISACPNVEQAIDDGSVATGQHWIACSSPTANGTSASPTPLLVATGPTVGVLTSGDVANVAGPNDSTGTTTTNGTTLRGADDVSIVKLDLTIPAGAQCLAFDFVFGSEEYPEYVGSFNDGFLAELDTDDWSVAGNDISAPHNFAFDGDGHVVSVNSTFFDAGRVVTSNGMEYDGATPKLTARTPVTAGLHALYLSIFDAGDDAYDSGAIVDNLRTSTTPCAAGAGEPPIAQDDSSPAVASAATDEDTATDVHVLDNDSDPDGDSLTVTTVSAPLHGTATINANGTVHYVPNANYNGGDGFTYTISDGHGGTDTATVSVVVNPKNDAPTLAAIANVDMNEGGDVTVNLSAADVDGDLLTLSTGTLPSFATFTDNHNGTGTIRLQPGFSDAGGPTTIAVTVKDPSNAQATRSFTVTVHDVAVQHAPVLAAITNKTMAELATLPVSLSATDQDGGVITLTATSKPAFGTLTDNGGGTGTITFKPGCTDASSYTVTIKATDPGGLFDTKTFTLTVTNTPCPPSMTQPGDTTMLEGVSADVNLSATDPDGGNLKWSLDPGAPAWASVSASGGPHVHLAPGYADAGDVQLTVRVTDPTGLSDSKLFTVHVIDVAPKVSIGDASVKEIDSGTVDLTFALKLDRKDPSPRTVKVTTHPGSATEGVDYLDLTTTITFPPNTTSATATVTVIGDLLKELTESLTLDVVAGGTAGTTDGSGAGTILDDGDVCTIVGTSGNDTLDGTNGADYICGLAGNDTISGLGGNDTILAGAGNDDVAAGPGADTVEGGDDDDHITGGDGNDVLYGNAGNDRMNGSDGNDHVDGGNDNDLLEGGDGNDTVLGGKGDDELHGGTGVNDLEGGPGADTCSRGPDSESYKSCTFI